jgi:hypothetical protein
VIVQISWLVLIFVVVIALMFVLFFFQQGFPLWASFALGIVSTYLLFVLLAVTLHWLLRSIVGREVGYLPAWKVPLWGTMAALHHRLFSALKLFLPREYTPNALLKAFGLRIGSGSASMGYITDPEMIIIGNNVHIGPGTILSGHIMSRADRRVFRAPVMIENGVRIGKNCVIPPGVRVGPKAVILPNTHVRANQELKGGRLYGGNPAAEILSLKED